MKRLEASVQKIRKGIDDSFRSRNAARGVPDHPKCLANTTCSQGQMVTVDYFALNDLLRYFEETKKISNRVLVARHMLDGVFFGRPADIEKTIREVLSGR